MKDQQQADQEWHWDSHKLSACCGHFGTSSSGRQLLQQQALQSSSQSPPLCLQQKGKRDPPLELVGVVAAPGVGGGQTSDVNTPSASQPENSARDRPNCLHYITHDASILLP